jgi:hypothetical protein
MCIIKIVTHLGSIAGCSHGLLDLSRIVPLLVGRSRVIYIASVCASGTAGLS